MADKILFQDDTVQLLLADNPSVKGHLLVRTSRADATLASMSELEIFEFFMANSNAATALFELIGAQGTNILIEDGAQLSGAVIARTQTDGIDMLWPPQKGDPHELEAAAKSIKDEIDLQVWAKDNSGKTPGGAPSPSASQASPSQTLKEPTPEEKKEGKINYLLHRLRRRP